VLAGFKVTRHRILAGWVDKANKEAAHESADDWQRSAAPSDRYESNTAGAGSCDEGVVNRRCDAVTGSPNSGGCLRLAMRLELVSDDAGYLSGAHMVRQESLHSLVKHSVQPARLVDCL
jgi:hypothetical protein